MACTDTTLRLLIEVMDAFGVRVRIGAELFVSGCKALFRHWNLVIVGRYSGRDSSGAPPNTLQKRQQTTLEEINTLRTGDSDLRFYITTVQDG